MQCQKICAHLSRYGKHEVTVFLATLLFLLSADLIAASQGKAKLILNQPVFSEINYFAQQKLDWGPMRPTPGIVLGIFFILTALWNFLPSAFRIMELRQQDENHEETRYDPDQTREDSTFMA